MDIAYEEVWVRERAYWLWEEEGRPQGREFDHWVRARNEIAGRMTGAGAPAERTAAGAVAKKATPRKSAAKPRSRKTLQ